MLEPSIEQSPIEIVTLISSHREPLTITPIVNELNIYTDIFSSTMSGEITLKDTFNIISEFGLSGTEYLFIRLKAQDKTEFEKFFRVYKISDVKMLNLNVMSYKLHFVSEEFFLNQQARISKSYKGFYNHQIVVDILTNYLSILPDRIFFEPTLFAQESLIIPNMKPFEAINMVSSFSLNQSTSSAFVFFETISGFNFYSLESLYNQDTAKEIALRPENILVANEKLDNSNIIADFEFNQIFDSLQTVATGGYASSLIKMDLTKQKFETEYFDPVNSPFKTLNDYLPFNDAKNRNEKTLIDTSAFVRYFPKLQGDLVGKWLLQRAAQFALLNNNQFNIYLAGDSELESGSIVEISFPYFKPSNSVDEIFADPYKSGRYLVTAVRHRVVNGIYTNYVQLCKDSNLSGYPSSENVNLTNLYKTASAS